MSGWEPGHISGVSDEKAGDHRADTVDVGETGPGGSAFPARRKLQQSKWDSVFGSHNLWRRPDIIRKKRVYTMRMSRVNVYLPDELADEAKKAGLNISSLTQEAIRSSLAAQDLAHWQRRVAKLDSPGVSHHKVIDAVRAAKDELDSD